MARAGGYLDLVISIDGDFSLGYGCPIVVFVSCGQSDRGKLWKVEMCHIAGHVVGKLDFSGWDELDLRAVAVAAGCDYVQRSHGWGWPKLVNKCAPPTYL